VTPNATEMQLPPSVLPETEKEANEQRATRKQRQEPLSPIRHLNPLKMLYKPLLYALPSLLSLHKAQATPLAHGPSPLLAEVAKRASSSYGSEQYSLDTSSCSGTYPLSPWSALDAQSKLSREAC
jgi:hypothetical protein